MLRAYFLKLLLDIRIGLIFKILYSNNEIPI